MPSRDEVWMERALEWARKGEGLTRPNPPVGAVVVRSGQLIAEGYHQKAGGAHAEVNALRKAGERARGSTLYVTLEPCCTWGRTPPCTKAILEAGVARVVIGCTDPNPRHAGRGIRLLRRAGVEVQSDVCRAACEELIEPFALLMREGRPFVTLKLGVTLDGRIADERGASRWITGPGSRRAVHDLRRRVDAILVGHNTARRDNPSLVPVPSRGRKPWRVVLDAAGNLPLRSRLFADGLGRQTLVVTSSRSPLHYRASLRARGVEVEVLPTKRGQFAMRQLLLMLGRRGLLHVLCEGGGALAGSLIRDGLVDEAWFFYAPRLLGANAVPAVGGPGWTLRNAPAWKLLSAERVGDDVWVRVRPEQ
ncbi:MAG: bifunctional diaminohydroxyphosphoribosylaminopyrimidine deaminase/5-amino-6-(5-phosphoribosylamino)uracil reductase RibD [Kiritimatiellae bacterium]|nr:bifunctional diaminohydroxyphosphoribosylaminopyrimidine deaminase/5-amino-6-(5-phosphoribosylamino)uracil reductase RibD [Kiritimatiellia bacterium]